MDSQSSADSGGVSHRPPAVADFPAGLRVLLVDDDRTCLSIVAAMLKKCLYHVTTSMTGMEALDILRKNRRGFDIVLSDVYMPDMDGFKLLEHIGLEMDLPVIMMSADDKKDVVMKGVTHGACDYLIKPVSMEALKNIWQHVFRRKRNELKDLENSGSLEENDKHKKASEDGDIASSGNEGNWKIVKRKKDGEDEDEFEEREDTSTLKKPRVVWSVDLHQQFVAAVNQLGLDKAVPKKILELMNNPSLTRENVASHLQKYRLYLKRVSVSQHQGRADASFPSTPDSSYCSITSLDGFELQALAASGQLPAQALVNLHSAPRRPTNICMDMSPADQRGFFTTDAPIVNSSKIRSTMVQQVNNNQMNLLYGSPAPMEARQIGQAQQMFRSYGNMGFQVSEGAQGFMGFPSSLRASSAFSGGTINGHSSNSLVQMNQQGQHVSLAQQQDHVQSGVKRPQSRGQLLNGIASEHDSRVSSTIGQQMVSNGTSNVLRTGTAINGGTSLQGNYMNMPPYGAVPQSLYPNVQNSSMNGSSCHPHINSTALANQTSTVMIQDAMTAAPGSLEALDNVPSLKGVKDVIPNYDMFNDLHQNKNQEWKLQNVISYESSRQHGTKQSNIDYGSQVATHQDFNATLKDGVARNTGTFRKERFLIRAEIEHEQVECLPQDGLFADDISNELMSVFGRQPQESVGPVEPDFSFERLPFET